MFKFTFVGQEFKVSLETGEPEVSPFNSGVQAHVNDVFEDVTKGQYFPDPNDLEQALSDALGGDFKAEPNDPIDVPDGAKP